MNRTGKKKRIPNDGKGRPKGATNKVTRFFKEALMRTYAAIGGDDAFREWALQNQTEFYKICARLIPQETRVSTNGTEMVERVVVVRELPAVKTDSGDSSA